MTIRFYNWSVIANATPYTAPEAITYHLCGTRFGESLPVTTTAIVSSNGREVTTQSGSVYLLGSIDPSYIKFMHDNNIKYDYNQPIKFKQ